MIKLLNLLYEVFDSQYPVKDREMTEPPHEGKIHIKKHISVFHAEGHKFIIEVYEYPHHFYLVAFYPKLNRDFSKNKYRIQLNLKNKYGVLSTVFNHMGKIINDDPLACIGFYGAPDVDDDVPGYSTQDSKRYQLYLKMVKRFGFYELCEIVTDPNLSSITLLNKENLKQDPELEEYSLIAMDNAIS